MNPSTCGNFLPTDEKLKMLLVLLPGTNQEETSDRRGKVVNAERIKRSTFDFLQAELIINRRICTGGEGFTEST